MSRKVLPVVFSGLAPFMNNKILDRSFMAKYPGGEAGTVWAERIVSAGYEFMTIDRYYYQDRKRPALLISDMASGVDKSSGLIPALCMSLESPIVASRYYHHIARKTRPFQKIWDWAGAARRIPDAAGRFMSNAWPTTANRSTTFVPWKNRRFLTLISSNKRALQWNRHPFSLVEPHRWARNLVSNFNTTYIKTVDDWMKSELYLERLQAISYFARYQSFDLYGSGWNILQSKAERSVRDQIARSWRGKLHKNKIEFLTNYQFYLCFENTSFPGYLTEKIFECLFSGVIPVYLGDPDIQKRVPAEAFIDARHFSSYSELDDFLQSVTPALANDYLDAARQFLESDSFYPFTAEALADTILFTMNEVCALYQ